MRTGNYEASEGGSSAGTAMTFLLIGLGAGALLGLLLAPKAGKQIRKDLRKKYDNAKRRWRSGPTRPKSLPKRPWNGARKWPTSSGKEWLP